MKVIIPLAGKGTRLRPHTHVTPKPMLKVAGRPVMSYVMDDVLKLGDVEQVVYITGHLKDKVEAYARTTYDIPSVFIDQAVQDGTAGAVALAKPFADQPLLIIFVGYGLLGTWVGLMLAHMLVTLPYGIRVLSTSLSTLPASVEEAAASLGAPPSSVFRRITLPLMRRPLAFVLVADTAINFLLFAPVYVITHGGPAGSTALLMFEAYQAAFALLNHGRSLAISTVILAIIGVIAVLELRLFRAAHERAG
jgi:ABC-type molybdate transport system permease subunit